MKKRNSNIELLRIISMIMIVLSHYTVHNGVENYLLPFGINRYLLEITTLGNTGVILFILITGYFSIDKEKIAFKKIFLLVTQTLFYSVTIYLIFCLLGNETISMKTIVYNFMPITFKQYWFVTAYLLLYIFIPYINIFLNNLKKEEFKKFLFINFIIFSIFGIISDLNASDLTDFIFFYSIGAYIKKYNIIYNKKYRKVLIISLLMLLLAPLLCDFSQKYIQSAGYFSIYLFSKHSPVNILFAVSIFIWFITLKEFCNKFINYNASLMLGVYLIHDNYYIRGVLWTIILKEYNYVDKGILLLHMLVSILLVFTFCCIIELIRKNTIEKLLIFIYNKLETYIKKRKYITSK